MVIRLIADVTCAKAAARQFAQKSCKFLKFVITEKSGVITYFTLC